MRTQDADILIIPGVGGLNKDHWLSRWNAKLKTARLVEQENWDHPQLESWCSNVLRAAEEAQRPIVFVAHQCGVHVVAHVAAAISADKIAGAYLVSPPHLEDNKDLPEVMQVFAPVPKQLFAFPARVIASRTNPLCKYAKARKLSEAWGAGIEDAGDAGPIDNTSGQGPWPEGLLSFAHFMKDL